MIPAGATCSQHPGAPAVAGCQRCGDFLCAACVRSVRKVAIIYCPACLERRASYLSEGKLGGSGVSRPHTAIICGVLSVVPFLWPVWIAAIVVGIMCLTRAHKEGGRGRVAGLVALGGVGVGVALTITIFALALA
jgi:hypothetical protein